MSREAMQMALEALDLLAKWQNPFTKWQVRKPKDGGPIVTIYPHKVATDAAIALRQALRAKQKTAVSPDGGTGFIDGVWHEPGPKAWQCQCGKAHTVTCISSKPSKKEWVGLTEEDIHNAFQFTEYVKQLSWDRQTPEWCENFAAYIEAKLKEKNT